MENGYFCHLVIKNEGVELNKSQRTFHCNTKGDLGDPGAHGIPGLNGIPGRKVGLCNRFDIIVILLYYGMVIIVFI